MENVAGIIIEAIRAMDTGDIIVALVVGALISTIYLLLKEVRASRESWGNMLKENNTAISGLQKAVTYVGDRSVESAQINERTAQMMANALTSALVLGSNKKRASK